MTDRLIRVSSPQGVAHLGAARIAEALRTAISKVGMASIALSGGETPRATYAALAQEPNVNWRRVEFFWVDERAVPPDNERSNYHLVKTTLLDPAQIPPQIVHRMRGEATNLDGAAQDYQAIFRNRMHTGDRGVPRFDVMVLGIGEDGHTASLFPGEPSVHVEDRFVVAVPAKGKREARLTLTTPVIRNARIIFMLAIGEKKRPALERVVAPTGNLDETPARVVRESSSEVFWIVDEAAKPRGLTGVTKEA